MMEEVVRLKKDEIFSQIKIAVDAYPRARMADNLSMEYPTLSNELNPNESSSHAKLGFLTALGIIENTQGSSASDQCKRAGLKAVDLIEEGLGRVAFPIPTFNSDNLAPLMKQVSKMSKEFGQTVQEIAYAMQDNKITKKEAQACIRKAADLVKACIELQANLRLFLK